MKNKNIMEYKEADIPARWNKLEKNLEHKLDKTPDLKGILFLIGVNELGKGPISFTKEEKQDLIHIGNCKVLSLSNYYTLEGIDEDGWPHWIKKDRLPPLSAVEQERLLKWHILEYFEEG